MTNKHIYIGKTYRHFKGNLYKILALAVHTEIDESLVIYQALYGEQTVYARPQKIFLEEIDLSKYPTAEQKLRFELVPD